MSTTTTFSPEQIEKALNRATPEQIARMYRLAKIIKDAAPPPKPVTLTELVALETDLTLFFREAWKFLNPGRELTWSWHYDLIAEHLMLVKQRKLRRLILNVPPRTAKSSLVTICFPCWMWTTEPTHEFLCASHSRDLSTDHSVARRNLLTSPWYQALWGDKFQLSSDRNLTTQFNNDHQGRMIATSTGSGAEGKGGDTAILDDPMSSEQSLSDVERYGANRWVTNTLKQRLNNPATAAIIIIMQRLHELDTTGFVLSEEAGAWTQIVIPLVAEKDERWVFPISGRIHERKKGDVLQEDRFTPVVVAEKQRNRMVFAGQYQQRPAPLEGNMIKRSEVKYYGGIDPLTGERDEVLPERFDRMLISVDCSFKDTETSNYVAIGVIGVKGRKRMVLNVVNEHLDANGTELEIRRQKERYPNVTAILVEDKANGPAVTQRLKANVPGVIEVTPMGGKIARMFAVAPEWQAGDWYVDRTAAWTEPFIQQITMFPTAANDDMCDMMTQSGIWLGGGFGMVYKDAWSEDLLYDDGDTEKIKLIRSFGGHGARYIGVSYGVDRPLVYLDCIDDGKTLWFDREFYWDARTTLKQKTDSQYADDLVEFMKHAPDAQVILPPDCRSFELQIQQKGIWYCNADSDVNDNDGIRTIATMMSNRNIRVNRTCLNTVREIPAYGWEAKAHERGSEEPMKTNADCCMAMCNVVKTKIQSWRASIAA